MVIKCPYCGSVDVSKEYCDEEIFNTSAKRSYDAHCEKCRKGFCVEVMYDLRPVKVTYLDDICLSLLLETEVKVEEET